LCFFSNEFLVWQFGSGNFLRGPFDSFCHAGRSRCDPFTSGRRGPFKLWRPQFESCDFGVVFFYPIPAARAFYWSRLLRASLSTTGQASCAAPRKFWLTLLHLVWSHFGQAGVPLFPNTDPHSYATWSLRARFFSSPPRAPVFRFRRVPPRDFGWIFFFRPPPFVGRGLILHDVNPFCLAPLPLRDRFLSKPFRTPALASMARARNVVPGFSFLEFSVFFPGSFLSVGAFLRGFFKPE